MWCILLAEYFDPLSQDVVGQLDFQAHHKAGCRGAVFDKADSWIGGPCDRVRRFRYSPCSGLHVYIRPFRSYSLGSDV